MDYCSHGGYFFFLIHMLKTKLFLMIFFLISLERKNNCHQTTEHFRKLQHPIYNIFKENLRNRVHLILHKCVFCLCKPICKNACI